MNRSGLWRWLIVSLVVVVALLAAAWAMRPDDELRVSFLDVGQGDAILISRGSQQVLVDGGPSPEALVQELGRRLPFWDRTIELVVSTHQDADHLAGLVEVLSRYKVTRVLTAGLEAESDVAAAWRQALGRSGASVMTVRAGMTVTSGALTLAVLSPPAGEAVAGGQADENCLVLRLACGEVSFLLMGDAGAAVERALIRERAPLAATVLKVGHHGSETGTLPEFLDVVRPRAAVISAGADNRFGHPAPEVTARLEARLDPVFIYRTDRQGSITFITDGQRLRVETG